MHTRNTFGWLREHTDISLEIHYYDDGSSEDDKKSIYKTTTFISLVTAADIGRGMMTLSELVVVR